MSTEFPYAADAEVSLSYDELEVSMNVLTSSRIPDTRLSLPAGLTVAISEGTGTEVCHCADQIQLRMGFG